MPYSGMDTIVFVSNTNDTAVCVGQGKTQFFWEYPYYSNPDCPPNVDYYEAYHYKIVSDNSKFKLDITIYKNDGYGLPTIHIIYNQIDFPIYVERVDRKITADFIDSLKVRNTWYKNVSITGKYFNPKLDRLYYNKQFGVLKIQNADSTEVWELIN